MDVPKGWHETTLPVDPDIEALTKYLGTGKKRGDKKDDDKKDDDKKPNGPFKEDEYVLTRRGANRWAFFTKKKLDEETTKQIFEEAKKEPPPPPKPKSDLQSESKKPNDKGETFVKAKPNPRTRRTTPGPNERGSEPPNPGGTNPSTVTGSSRSRNDSAAIKDQKAQNNTPQQTIAESRTATGATRSQREEQTARSTQSKGAASVDGDQGSENASNTPPNKKGKGT